VRKLYNGKIKVDYYQYYGEKPGYGDRPAENDMPDQPDPTEGDDLP
jgi:hypothetical protein